MSLTIILIIITALISYQAVQNPSLYDKLVFQPYTIKRKGEWHRFLTHGFIHSRQNWTHLMVNMFVLYQVGENVESYFNAFFGQGIGRIALLFLYLSAIICSSIPSYLKHQDNPAYGAVGASGATSALIFAFALFQPWAWFIFPPLPAILMAVGYVFYSNYMSKQSRDNIGHDAHMYGAIYGLLCTLALAFALNPKVIEYIIQAFLAGPTPPPFF